MTIHWVIPLLVLTISDILHDAIFWNVLDEFYTLLANILRVRYSPIKIWLFHESFEMIYHFVILSTSMTLLSGTLGFALKVAVIGALTHFTLDLVHTALLGEQGDLEHRSFHILFEGIVFWFAL